MARHHIASAMVALGDTSKLEILYAGLKSKDIYNRADAANMLGAVAESISDDKKAQIVALATQANEADGDDVSAKFYAELLKKLAGE